MKLVNGKEYPLWGQFIDRKEEWIGGTLQEFGDNMDRMIHGDNMPELITTIKDIELRPNGKESAFFAVEGEAFGCGFDVGAGGITAGEDGWITFSGYGGHMWRIKQKEKDG